MVDISWGNVYDNMKKDNFNEKCDLIYSFNSEKKSSTCVIHKKDGSARLFCKGASEWIIKDFPTFTGNALAQGTASPTIKLLN
jgi:magnesium-transporting ATPase (P-type)